MRDVAEEMCLPAAVQRNTIAAFRHRFTLRQTRRTVPIMFSIELVIAAWVHDRNAQHTKSDWHLTTKDARIKLKHLYPSI